jgi:hypothetical protein
MLRTHQSIKKFVGAIKRSLYHGTSPVQSKPDRLASANSSEIAFSLGLIGLGYWFISERLKQSFWTKTQGRIESCSNVENQMHNVSYSFTVNNYKCDGEQTLKRAYTPGTIVDVYVDTKDPFKNNAIKKSRLTDAGAGMVLLSVGLFALKRSLR